MYCCQNNYSTQYNTTHPINTNEKCGWGWFCVHQGKKINNKWRKNRGEELHKNTLEKKGNTPHNVRIQLDSHTRGRYDSVIEKRFLIV